MENPKHLPSIRWAMENNNTDLENVLIYVLNKIVPNNAKVREIYSLAEKIRKDIIMALNKSGIEADVALEGSVAKGTWLSDDVDFDFFVLVDYRPNIDKDEYFLSILNAIRRHLNYKFELRYSEHPYLRAKINGYEVDIAPAFKAPPSHIISSFDRTPHHTKFVLSKMSPILANEIRLLKAFLRGIDTYGAEVKIGGLSGYACELLVIYFGSFIRTIQEFSKKPRIFVDLTSSWRPKDAAKKFKHNFILIDPTDKNRNVASALRQTTWSRIQLLSKLFLEKPTTEFFFPKKPTVKSSELKEAIQNRQISLIILQKNEAIPADVYWGQTLRISNKIKNKLAKSPFGFIFIDAFEVNNYIIIAIETIRKKLSPIKKIIGPPVTTDMEHILQFYQKHKNDIISGPWIEENRLYALIRYGKTSISEHLTDFISSIKIKPSFTKFRILENPDEIYNFIRNNQCCDQLYKFLFRNNIQIHLDEITKKH